MQHQRLTSTVFENKLSSNSIILLAFSPWPRQPRQRKSGSSVTVGSFVHGAKWCLNPHTTVMHHTAVASNKPPKFPLHGHLSRLVEVFLSIPLRTVIGTSASGSGTLRQSKDSKQELRAQLVHWQTSPFRCMHTPWCVLLNRIYSDLDYLVQHFQPGRG